MNEAEDRSVSGVESEGRASEPEDENGAIGIFPSWGWLYVSIIVYTVLVIALLHVFTVTLDFSLS